MTNKELILLTLEQKMGFSPETDDEGDIFFPYQMKTIYVCPGEYEPCVSVMLFNFHEIQDGTEPKVLAVTNRMNRELRFAKVFVEKTFKHVSASCDFYYNDEEALEQNLRHSLEVLGVIRSLFRMNMDELSED